MNTVPTSTPKTGIAGLRENWRGDMRAGFLVSLIALPLCLGIAVASGFPPLAGIISAVIGGLLVSRLNGSHVTVNGPAAGLIVVIFDAVQSMGQGDALAGYRYTLAAIVVSGGLQVGLGVYRSGRLAAFFPTSVMHGLLAAIGIIIMAKQIPVMAGVTPQGGAMLAGMGRIPHELVYFIPQVACIGLLSVGLLIGWPRLQNRLLRKVPAPLAVVLAGVLLGKAFGLSHLNVGQDFILPKDLLLGPDFLVAVPDSLADGIYFPDFGKLGSLAFWQSVLAITLIGSLESLMIASAVDKLDPCRRRSDLNRDLRAVGIGNVVAGCVGGLPMIAEVVRSSANIDGGAKTGWSNFFHGVFLLLLVALLPWLVRQIPLASLAALLVYTGYRLASPHTFGERWALGWAQLAVFVITIAGVLVTNLLAGVAIGIAAKVAIHLARGVSLKDMLRISYTLERQGGADWVFRVSGSAVFSNFIALKSEVSDLPEGGSVVFDLSDAYLIDHTVMEFIDQFRQDYIAGGGRCEIHGLDRHEAYGASDQAARRQKPQA